MNTASLTHLTLPRIIRGKNVMRLAVTLCLAVLTLAPAQADAATLQVKGTFTFDVQAPLVCPPPAFLCATGTFTGGLKGSFTNMLFYLSPSPTPGVTYYDGKITLSTSTGALFCDLDGALNTLSEEGEFGEICVITGGTGRFNQASGHLRLMGVSIETSPIVIGSAGGGEYKGKIITPSAP